MSHEDDTLNNRDGDSRASIDPETGGVRETPTPHVDAAQQMRATSQNEGKVTNWRHEGLPVVRDGDGRPRFCMATAVALLEHHPEWHGVLKFNEFSGKCEIHEVIPGADTCNPNLPRELEDVDVTHSIIWFNRNGFPNSSKAIVSDAKQVPQEKISAGMVGAWNLMGKSLSRKQTASQART